MKKHIVSIIMALTMPLNGSNITFNIEHPTKDENGDFIQGRVLLFLSDNNLEEPRFQTNDKSSTAFVFGVDLKQKNSSKTIMPLRAPNLQKRATLLNLKNISKNILHSPQT